MPRLIDMPVGLRYTSRVPLSGPRAARAGASESTTGFAQTVASAFGLWRWQFTFTAMHNVEARRYRGLVTALHGGANAVRVPFRDPDGLTYAESGVNVSETAAANGVPWSNGQPFSNGKNWSIGRPNVALSAAAARYADTISLSSAYWRDNLGVGDQIGFTPGYYGLHIITEVKGGGVFRIWPPLRAALTTSQSATLTPVMVMRLESESAAPIARGITTLEPPTMTLLEVEDADVRAFYTS